MHTCCIQARWQERSFNSQFSEQLQVLLLQTLELFLLWRRSRISDRRARGDGEVLFFWLGGTYLLSGIDAKILMLCKLQMQ